MMFSTITDNHSCESLWTGAWCILSSGSPQVCSLKNSCSCYLMFDNKSIPSSIFLLSLVCNFDVVSLKCGGLYSTFVRKQTFYFTHILLNVFMLHFQNINMKQHGCKSPMHFITNKHYSGSILTGSVAVGAHYILYIYIVQTEGFWLMIFFYHSPPSGKCYPINDIQSIPCHLIQM